MRHRESFTIWSSCSRLPPSRTHLAGVSLLELLVVLAITAVLLSMALPGYRLFSQRQELSHDLVRLHNALNLARNSAITLGQRTTLCPSHDGANCSHDWSDSLLLFSGPADDSQILYRFESSRIPSVIYNRGAAIVFQPSGRASGYNGTFTLCMKSGQGATLILSNFGRTRQGAEPVSC
uniref:GspH/FimT family pseudopilin n=1 Tax=Halomonas sp. TaxID=1486246 RepID=UPI003457DBDE